MIELPKGFPMFCIDLKQTKDEKKITLKFSSRNYGVTEVEELPNYPQNKNEHNALSDARWTKQLHEFLKKI
jgi:hypothetical protein